MFKLMSTLVAASLFLLAGCATQGGGTGGSAAMPEAGRDSPFPEYFGRDRWGTPPAP